MGLTEPEDNEEDDLIAALERVAHHVHVGPKPHQKRTASGFKPKPLTKRQLDWIVAQVNAGKIHLPEPEQLTDDDYCMVWALADSGSAAHVADVSKHFPGAPVRESAAPKQGVKYVGATGDTISNRGEAEIHFWTPDGQNRMTVFQNASVGMPILSISKLTDEGNDVLFTKKWWMYYTFRDRKTDALCEAPRCLLCSTQSTSSSR